MNSTNPYQPPETITDRTVEKQFCFVSSPEHLKTIWGRWIYIYTGNGHIELIGRSLIYTDKKGEQVHIDVGCISNVSIGSFSRIAKPLRLNYIAIEFSVRRAQETIYFTPTTAPSTPVWQTNRIVACWARRIRDASDTALI